MTPRTPSDPRAARRGSEGSNPGVTAPITAPATLSPAAALRQPLFRVLVLVQLGNAVGVWVHVVAVQWILTDSGQSAAVVALAPAAMSLPFLALALPMGVVVSFASREVLMAAAMAASALACAAAWLLYSLDSATPVLLLATVLAVGVALVSVGVAWQSLLPETVETSVIGSAAALDGAVFNAARAVGPILAGVGLAVAGPQVVFAANSVLFLVCAVGLALLSRRHPGRRSARQPIGPAVLEGLWFVRHSPWTRRLLGRMIMFGLPASALWALVSLVARDRLSLGARDFGILMGMLGIGAVLGTVVLAPLRQRMGHTGFAVLGSLVYAASLVALATVGQAALVAVALLLAGAAWVGVQSTWMTLAHQALPDWVRPRVVAVILLLFQGTQAVGAIFWGRLTDLAGLSATLLAAAVVMTLSAALLARRGLMPSAGIEPRLADPGPWTAPVPATLGPLVVEIQYAVHPGSAEEFLHAVADVRMSRLRLGARDWELLSDPARPGVYLERFDLRDGQALQAQNVERLTVPELALRHRLAGLAEVVSAPHVLVAATTKGRTHA